MLIYTIENTARLQYITSVLLKAVGVSSYMITDDANQFSQAEGMCKINYSHKTIAGDTLWMAPVDLLFQKGIEPQHIECFDRENYKAFYQSAGMMGFDLFAAAFYLLTRYEEYLPYTKDSYGRFAFENSLAHQHNFLHLPLVNIWLQHFSKVLQQYSPALKLKPASFRFLPTYDVDIAFNYLHKSATRNMGGFIKSMLKFQWNNAWERLQVLVHHKSDPYDIFPWLDALHDTHNLKPVYFFLLAATIKGYDKNIDPSNPAYRQIIQDHACKYQVGIHPSWQSGDNENLLQEEIKTLQQITAKPVKRSRQHYIRMSLPATYEQLLQAGITDDYSMGYGSINGFRASYCLPYPWYNLKHEEFTRLMVHPFCFMEANAWYEQQLTPVKALEEMQHYYAITKQVQGLYIMIWHNHILGNPAFAGYRQAYVHMVAMHKNEGVL